MARNAASPSMTGGAGYNHADRVAAKYLLEMLDGRLPFGPEYGQVVRVDWEVRDQSNGWLVDDLRLTLRSQNTDRFAAVSVKRNRQVTSAGFPSDFVGDAWEMILGNTATEFDSNRDLLALAVGELSQDVREAWTALLRQASETTADRLAQRISSEGTASNLQRSLFESLGCPQHLQSALTLPRDIATANLVPRLRLLHLDFTSDPSDSLTDALALAKDLVVSGTDHEAHSLWNALVGIAAKQRESGGAIDLNKLLSQPDLPPLREHPDLQRDWDQIATACDEATTRVRTDLGSLTLLRAKVFDRVLAMVKPQSVGVLLGDSGSGKSALAKRLIHHINGPTIWLDPVLLNVASMTELQSQKLDLQTNLRRLIHELAAPRGLIVIDSIERLAADSLHVAMQIIQAVSDTPKWSIIVSCRTDAWSRIVQELLSERISIGDNDVCPVPLLDSADLSAVAAALPPVSVLMHRPEVRQLLANIKVLDWTITAIQHGGDKAASARSIPGLIDAIWDRWIRSGSNRYGREHTLKHLAEREAEELGATTRLSDISEHHQALEGLIDDELLTEHEQQVRFRHDLIGDWARLKLLIERQPDDVAALRERVGLPLWQRAIQLYGQRILQSETNGSDRWRQLISAMQESDDHDVLIRDLMLESLFTATDAAALIELAWPTLVANHGYLLKRFLDRFLHAATIPAVEQAAQLDAEERLLLQSMSRYPFWPYWLVVLRSLHEHYEDVVSLAPKQVATIASIWMKWMPLTVGDARAFPCRAEAADLAVRTAFEVHARHQEGRRYGRDEHIGATVYGALLQAAHDRPDDVAELCLEIVGRRELSTAVRERVEAHEAEQQRLAEEAAKRRTPEQERQLRERARGLGPRLPLGEMIPPFPDGPSRHIDAEFRTACLEAGGILPLLHSRPDAGKEVFLAACIKSPYREDPWNGPDLIEDLDIEGRFRGSEPMWFQGPFLGMLQERPDDAVDIIIRLVSFATSRWEQWDIKCQRRYSEEGDAVTRRVMVITPDGDRLWLGDVRVYGWYRNRLGDAPLIVNALMALEKYLYDRVDAETDIAPVASKILAEADSVAFAGVLLAVGRYQLLTKQSGTLLCGELRPLLSIWQVYEWDRIVVQDTELGQVWRLSLMRWVRLGERIFNMVRDWHSMPHRTVDLIDVAVRLLLSSQDMREWFATVRARWTEGAGAAKKDETFELLLARFDPANYHFKQVDQGVEVTFEWPEHLRVRTEKALVESQQALEALSFPVRCRKLLDQQDPPSDADAEKFWEDLMGLVERASQEGKHDDQCAGIICGGIAVLVSRKIKWLETHPERFKWCTDQLADIVAHPPGVGEIAVPESVTETAWDVFFAESVVYLLAHDQNDNRYRLWACRGLCAFHYAATGFGMAAVWRCRKALGEDFYRLANIVTVWAGARYLMRWAERCSQARDRYGVWTDRAIAAFVAGDLTTRNLSLARVSEFGSRISGRIREREHRRHWGGDDADADEAIMAHNAVRRRRRELTDPGLDVTVIQHALSPLHDLEKHGSGMRTWQIQMFKQALGITLRMLGTPDEDSDGERDGVPYDYDNWALRQIVLVVVQMTEDENPQDLWKRILGIRATAYYWLESFASAWVSDGLAACDDLQCWGRQWRAMIEFALGEPNWRRAQRGASHLDDAWIELLGMGLGGHQLRERADLVPVISDLIPHYERWAQEWLSEARCASAFAGFITKPAARPMLMSGVRWLLDNTKSWRDNDWQIYHLAESLTSLTHHIWLNHRSSLDKDEDARSLFLDLLNLIASRQHQPALQLRDEVQRQMRSRRS